MILLVLTPACNQHAEAVMPPYTGRPGEILAVLSNPLYDGKTGDAIGNVLKRPMYGLPQEESEFALSTIPPESFSGSFKTHLNVLVIQLDDKEAPGIFFKRSVWAKGQVVASVVARDDAGAAQLLQTHADELRSFFKSQDHARLLKSFEPNEELTGWLRKEKGLTMRVPFDYYLAVDTPGFVWLRRETQETSSGLVLLHKPYTDTSSFSRDSLLGWINEAARKYIPGPTEGSYFRIYDKYPVRSSRVTFGERFMVELRGLWRVEGDYMGGPFVGYTEFDSRRERIVMYMGFVYAPKFDKRDYVRDLEAILSTVRFEE